MPLKNLISSRLNGEESAECAERFNSVLAPIAPTDPTTLKLLDMIIALAIQLRTALGISRANSLTKAVTEKDAERDRAHHDLTKYLRGMQAHLDPAIAQAAQRLYGIIRQFGITISSESYAVESSRIKALVDELSDARNSADVELIGLGDHITALRLTEEAFCKAHLELLNSKADIGVIPHISDLLNPMRKLLRHTVDYIAVMEVVDPDKWADTVKDVDEIITELNARVRARQTRESNEDEPPSEPPVEEPA